jgi:ribulose-phosphate 3-epimerase
VKRIFPSLLASSLLDISTAIQDLSSLVDGFHIDLADGLFTPQPLGSIELIYEVTALTQLPLWVHLMVADPLEYISKLAIRPADIISFHYESIQHENMLTKLHQIATLIAQQHGIASCAISPQTSLAEALPLLTAIPDLHHLLLMTVKPGTSGQHILAHSYERYQALRKYLTDEVSRPWTIGLDGGLNPSTIAQFHLAHNNADLAIGSYIMQADDKVAAAKKMRSI